MYGKIFASIYKGSMRGKADPQAVLIYMIANCDKAGCLDETQQCIAEAIGRPVDAVREACLFLEAADPESRSTDENGARIVRVAPPRSWGWRIVNHAKYVAIRNEEDRREQNREAAKRHRVSSRQQPSADVSTRQHASAAVSMSQQPSAESAHADADADTEGESRNAPTPPVEKDGKLIKALRGLMLPCHPEAVADWKAALLTRIGVTSPDEAADFLEFAIEAGKRDGVTVQYPRHAAVYIDAWRARA